MTRNLRRAGIASGLLVALAIFGIGVVWAATGVSIDQCANGTFASPLACTNAQFQNGNINENNSHYSEGSVVPFRQTFTGLVPGTTYSVTIGWQFLNSGLHAYDYITTYNATEASADPCTGVAGAVCTPAAKTTTPIPADPTLVAACNTVLHNAVPQIGGVFTLFGGNLVSAGPYSQLTCGSGNVDQSIVVTFTAVQATEVLAWGGHIATQSDWGGGQGATGISGSPYHMHQDACSFGCGSQDRSLKAAAVAALTMTTQRTPSGAVAPNQNVTDLATLAGNVSAFPSGTVQFYTCASITTTATIFPTCNSPANGTALGSPVTVGGSGSTGTATSPVFHTPQVGQYCFLAVYTPDSASFYHATTDNITSANQTAECWSQQNPTDVTLSSMSAHSVEDGMNWMLWGLGALGIVTLGGVVFVIARKR